MASKLICLKVQYAAPPGVASEFVVPLAAKIRKQHPGIQIEVLSGVELLNLARGEADLSLRTGKPTDPDLVCLDEISSTMRIYASSDYASNLPSKPDIGDLDWIGWAEHSGDQSYNRELAALIPDFKLAFASDDFSVQILACKAGLGAMILPHGLHRHTSLRELHELEIDTWPEMTGTLYLVCHKRHRHLPKVQLVIDFITRKFELLRSER